MFKVECYVDDKQLPTVLHALAAVRAMDVKSTPVTNATFVNGQIQARVPGGPVEQLAQWLKEKKLTRINADNLREFQTDIGRAPGGYALLLKNAKRIGLLKVTKGTARAYTTYDVQQPKH